jgi:tetratricopeptide (TPR) repeat protein
MLEKWKIMMQEFAHKLMNLSERQSETSVATAIFGTASTLARSLDTRHRIRIGMWPCVSEESPEVAMGLFTVLAFLLERWQDIRVYRLFAQLEGDPSAYQWTMKQSQFDVDDFELEALDENIGVWGTLKKTDDKWTFTVELDNDLEEEEQDDLTYEAETMTGLVNLLPKVAQDIAERVEVTRVILADYPETKADEAMLTPLLTGLFKWQANLGTALWGVDWATDSIETDLNKLIEMGKATGDALGGWCVSTAVAHAMLPGYGDVAEFVMPITDTIVTEFPDVVFPAMFLGNVLYAQGQAQRAYDLLEAGVTAHPKQAMAWTLLADLYRQGVKYTDSVGAYQRAIEAGAVSVDLYYRYAGFMGLLRGYEGEFILIDPDEVDDEVTTTWEAVEAYEEALTLDSSRMPLLQEQLLLLADVAEDEDDEKRLWKGFERLVSLDEEGEAVRRVVDALENLDDLQPAVGIFEKYIALTPKRADLYINLAATHILLEEEEKAETLLEKAEELTDDEDMLADIDRLMLVVDDPNFEERLGEVIGIVDSGTKLKQKDIDFLEDALEQAPSLAEAYVLLGKAYWVLEKSETAMETLLDGLKEVPDDPDMVEVLAGLLWGSGEKDLALSYLNKGVAVNPGHVGLLVLTGRCLFENDQQDMAKLFLGRAEALSPRHPKLAQVRAYIAQRANK